MGGIKPELLCIKIKTPLLRSYFPNFKSKTHKIKLISWPLVPQRSCGKSALHFARLPYALFSLSYLSISGDFSSIVSLVPPFSFFCSAILLDVFFNFPFVVHSFYFFRVGFSSVFTLYCAHLCFVLPLYGLFLFVCMNLWHQYFESLCFPHCFGLIFRIVGVGFLFLLLFLTFVCIYFSHTKVIISSKMRKSVIVLKTSPFLSSVFAPDSQASLTS